MNFNIKPRSLNGIFDVLDLPANFNNLEYGYYVYFLIDPETNMPRIIKGIKGVPYWHKISKVGFKNSIYKQGGTFGGLKTSAYIFKNGRNDVRICRLFFTSLDKATEFVKKYSIRGKMILIKTCEDQAHLLRNIEQFGKMPLPKSNYYVYL